ncbi:MAG: hypothetical protein P8188_13305 [Gemmatimonadota bacterium]
MHAGSIRTRSLAPRTALGGLLLILALSPGAAEAQSGWWSGITYQASLAQQDTELFSDGLQWRNFGLDFRRMVAARVSVGLFTGWHTFNQEVDGTLGLENVDISGLQRRYVNAFPLLATVHGYFRDARQGGPFAGLGVGTFWIENRVEVGRTAIRTDQWHFGLAPEVGYAFRTRTGLDPYLSVRYNHAFEAGDFTHGWWTFGIGIASGF